MTYASVPAIRLQADLAEKWLPKILSREYDPRNVPMEQKAGVTIGMAMTEKQGGTDVRANTTRAYPVGFPAGQAYELVGHKWFCSAPMCDAFLTLAYTDKGLTCFLLPRHRPDGSRNQFYIQRLKDKLGNWSNASSEIEYRGALAWMVGEEGRRADHHRDGRHDPLRLHDRLQRTDASGVDPGRPPLCLPQGRRAGAGRATADAERARRPGPGKRGGAGPDPAHGACPGPWPRRAGGEVRPPGHRGGQVLDLQACPGDDQRSLRMHGRCRLRRGNHPAAAVPRGPGELDLGRFRQRAVPGRAACPVEGAGDARRVVRRTGRRPWRRPSRRAHRQPQGGLRRHRRHPVPRPPAHRGRGDRPAGQAVAGSRQLRGVRRLHRQSPGDGGRVYGTLPRGVEVEALLARATPHLA